MASLRDLFKKSSSTSKNISKSISKGANKVVDFDLYKLKFIIHWFFAFIFFIWAFAYSFASYLTPQTFRPFGICCRSNKTSDEHVAYEFIGLTSVSPVFNLFLFYYVIIFLIFFLRALKGNKKKISLGLPFSLFFLNMFVFLCSELTLYLVYGYSFNEAIEGYWG